MANKPHPTPEVLRQLFRYEPETGKLFWKVRDPEFFIEGNRCPIWRAKRWNTVFAGRETGFVKADGYMKLTVFGRRMSFHRVCWAVFYGKYPSEDKQIDHIDRDKTNNRIENLRAVTIRQNCSNRSTTNEGSIGAYWLKRNKKWQSAIYWNGQQVYLGLYSEKAEAVTAYSAALDRINAGLSPLP